ncbi:MAG: hypothetical protein ACK41W_05630 [Cyanobacteriota bacterium]
MKQAKPRVLAALAKDPRLTPEQFEQVCQANPEAVLELGAVGAFIAMRPTGGGSRAIATAA